MNVAAGELGISSPARMTSGTALLPDYRGKGREVNLSFPQADERQTSLGPPLILRARST